MPELDKEKVAKVVSDASTMLKSVTEERDKLASKCALLERHQEARKVASAMHAKGLNRDVDFDELVSNLEKAAEEGRLPVIQEAIDMAGPNTGSIGSLSHDDTPVGGGTNPLESFILGDVG